MCVTLGIFHSPCMMVKNWTMSCSAGRRGLRGDTSSTMRAGSASTPIWPSTSMTSARLRRPTRRHQAHAREAIEATDGEPCLGDHEPITQHLSARGPPTPGGLRVVLESAGRARSSAGPASGRCRAPCPRAAPRWRAPVMVLGLWPRISPMWVSGTTASFMKEASVRRRS